MAITSRRYFCKTAAITASALTGMGTANFPVPAQAIEPILRPHGHKFKFSLASYSYRNLLSGKQPPLTMEDFIDDCARMNLDGAELTSYYFPETVSPHFLRQLKSKCFRLGLAISGTAIGNDFCHPIGDERQRQLAYVKQWIDNAELLGAPVIRIFAGAMKDGQEENQAYQLAVSAIEECCQYAGDHGVFLALENHGGLTATPQGLLKLVNDVKSPWCGVNVDTGNFHGDDVYADVAQVAPYAINVQIKVAVTSANGSTLPADFNQFARILKESNYRGYVVLEYEEAEDPRKACPRYFEQLREAFT